MQLICPVVPSGASTAPLEAPHCPKKCAVLPQACCGPKPALAPYAAGTSDRGTGGCRRGGHTGVQVTGAGCGVSVTSGEGTINRASVHRAARIRGRRAPAPQKNRDAVQAHATAPLPRALVRPPHRRLEPRSSEPPHEVAAKPRLEVGVGPTSNSSLCCVVAPRKCWQAQRQAWPHKAPSQPERLL
jgi:hypothetical protein